MRRTKLVMSRHRNLHNLCDDDYYDYDDDYDDDEYWEEDEDGYYKEQERLRKEQEAARQKAAAAKLTQKTVTKKPTTKKNTGISISKKKPAGTKPNLDSDENAEKVRLVVGMGFSSEMAKQALEKYDWDPQRSINYLLSNPSSGGMKMAPPTIGTMAPPPEFSKPPTKPPPSPKSEKLSTVKNPKPVLKSPKQKTTAKKSKADEDRNEDAVSSMKNISPEMKKRLKSQKSRLTMVILGHVDAGKSTLMGQVLVQMGMVQKRTVAKYQKQSSEIGKASFALAWIMDEDESERERGVTIDIATKHISTENHDITILDAPGHADYVPQMITGAGVSDVGILVVSSTKGEFESGFDSASGSGRYKAHVGQTREHITLARGLGVSQLIVAVNKLDNVEPAWCQSRYEFIKASLTPFIKQKGFKQKNIHFVPISGLNGTNVKERPTRSAGALSKWYDGFSLLEAINNFQPAKRNIEKPFRFIVSDLYNEGKGVVVKGRVVQGLVSIGDKVAILPIGDEATVSRIDHGVSVSQMSDDSDAERMKVALSGDSATLFLTGIDIARISMGNVISDFTKQFRPRIKKKIQAKILLMEEITVPIIRGTQILFHMHCLDVPGVVSDIISKVNKQDGSSIPRPRVLTGGSNATVEIKLNERISLETYEDCRSLGRFVLRRSGDTIAVGIIEKIH